MRDLVPPAFEAYARILHRPRRLRDVEFATGTWNARAAQVGVSLGPSTRWDDLQGPGSDKWSLWRGELSGPEVEDLVSIVKQYTSAAEVCSFGFWTGWGHLDGTGVLYAARGSLTQRLETWRARREERRRNERNRKELRRLPTFSTHGGNRSYLLFQGPVEEAGSFWSSVGQCPTMWWPADRAWFVHTHDEATSTYLGGSRALVDQLVGGQVMESFEVQTDTPIVW